MSKSAPKRAADSSPQAEREEFLTRSVRTTLEGIAPLHHCTYASRLALQSNDVQGLQSCNERSLRMSPFLAGAPPKWISFHVDTLMALMVKKRLSQNACRLPKQLAFRVGRRYHGARHARRFRGFAGVTLHTTPPSLLDRLRQAPEEADWRRLVHLYTPLLFSWARRAGATEHEAADVTQDVFLVLVRALPTFDRVAVMVKVLSKE